uniref:Rho termination factor-like N-terminal domain-containing protein n=1 Tax=Dulem virus 33 TaxID=3145751 RepID=A0AAU8B7T8_9CAUD
MTKAQLLAYAEENGIEGISSSMLKADILAAIKEAV